MGVVLSTPRLIECGKLGDLASLQAELRSGANPNVKDHTGHTPLYWCAWYSRLHLLLALLAAGADVDLADPDGMTPAMAAAYRGHGDALALLLVVGGASCVATDKRGLTVMHRAQGDLRAFVELWQQRDVQHRLAAWRRNPGEAPVPFVAPDDLPTLTGVAATLQQRTRVLHALAGHNPDAEAEQPTVLAHVAGLARPVAVPSPAALHAAYPGRPAPAYPVAYPVATSPPAGSAPQPAAAFSLTPTLAGPQAVTLPAPVPPRAARVPPASHAADWRKEVQSASTPRDVVRQLQALTASVRASPAALCKADVVAVFTDKRRREPHVWDGTVAAAYGELLRAMATAAPSPSGGGGGGSAVAAAVPLGYDFPLAAPPAAATAYAQFR